MRTCLLILFLAPFFSVNAQSTVYVSAREVGRGILKKRSGELFVITPHHVVEGAVKDIKIVGHNFVTSQATYVSEFPADFAVLRIDGGGDQPYKEWSIEKDFDDIVANSLYGFLDYREPDGTYKINEVVINSKSAESLTITPKTTGMPLAKGWSGSSLFVYRGNTKVFLGFLMEIDGKVGTVTRADFMMNMLGSFFKEENTTESSNEQPQNKSMNGALGHLVTKQIQMDIKRFEQNNNKAIFYFTLTNKNPSTQVIHYSSHLSYHKLIDQEGKEYAASDIQYGNTGSNVDLVYNVPSNCRVEFEVGANSITKAALLVLNGYNYDFSFYHIPVSEGSDAPKQDKSQVKTQKVLGKTIDKQILLTITGFEQNNNKVTFTFTLENQNPVKQILHYSSHLSYHQLIDQDGLSYNATYIKYGSQGSELDLVHKVPSVCQVEFDVGAKKITTAAFLQLNGYGYKFTFSQINLGTSSTQTNKPPVSAPGTQGSNQKYLASATEKFVRLGVKSIEQIGNKVIVYYTLENQDLQNTALDVSTHLSYFALDSDGYSFQGTAAELSNSGTQCRLVYGVPATCYAEFEVGAVQVSKIKRLKLGLYGYDFEFLASNGSLKSAKTMETNRKLAEEGLNAIFKLIKN